MHRRTRAKNHGAGHIGGKVAGRTGKARLWDVEDNLNPEPRHHSSQLVTRMQNQRNSRNLAGVIVLTLQDQRLLNLGQIGRGLIDDNQMLGLAGQDFFTQRAPDGATCRGDQNHFARHRRRGNGRLRQQRRTGQYRIHRLFRQDTQARTARQDILGCGNHHQGEVCLFKAGQNLGPLCRRCQRQSQQDSRCSG